MESQGVEGDVMASSRLTKPMFEGDVGGQEAMEGGEQDDDVAREEKGVAQVEGVRK